MKGRASSVSGAGVIEARATHAGFRLGCRLKGMVAFVVFVVIVSAKKRAGPRRVGVAIELM